MTDRQKILIKVIATLLTFGILYEMVAVFIYNDFLNSLIPGWHVTLYKLNRTLRDTILVSVSAVITYVLFKLIYAALAYAWPKLFRTKN